jgi:hypothetical protein
MNEIKLKQTIQSEFENDEKFSVVILTVVLTVVEIFIFLYKNCNTAKGLIKKSARKKGFLYKKFLKNHVYPKLNDSNLSEEEKEIAIEKVRQLIIQDKLDEFIP